MEPHAAAIVEDWALRDLIERLDATQELLKDTRERVKPAALRRAIYEAGDVLAAATDYLHKLRSERLRARVSA